MFKKIIPVATLAGVMLFGAAVASAATQTVIDTPQLAPIDIDGSSILRDFNVAVAGNITKVTVEVDLLFHPETVCSDAIIDGWRWPEELGLALISPSGTQAALVYSQNGPTGHTYTDSMTINGRYVIRFDDDAADLVGTTNGGLPTSGTFRPEEPLSVFQGEPAAGLWQLFAEDTGSGDPKCYFGATLNVETTASEKAPVPVPASSAWGLGLLGVIISGMVAWRRRRGL